MPKFWVGVASRDHVHAAVQGGFCQLNHGKKAPVERLTRGDKLLFYSPRTTMGSGQILQSFTAAGEITDDAPYQAEQAANFTPFRRKVRYRKVRDTPIEPLLKTLSFTREQSRWGMAFRRGIFEIGSEDFHEISRAMELEAG